MSSFSDYAENKVAELITGKTAFTLPTTYLALYTAAPSDVTASGTEVTGGSYARKLTAGSDWTAASGGVISNATVITFVTPTAGWGLVTHFAGYDALTTGNELFWAPLTASQTISTGNTVSFAIGALTITVT